jgi:hypothetical protein
MLGVLIQLVRQNYRLPTDLIQPSKHRSRNSFGRFDSATIWSGMNVSADANAAARTAHPINVNVDKVLATKTSLM